MQIKQLGLIENMTFEANKGQGSITDNTADWKAVNIMSGESKKGHLIKITDTDADSIQNRRLTTDDKTYYYVDSHCGGPNASEGCVTNTTRFANSPNNNAGNVNNIFLQQMYIKAAPSLLNPNENTFILIPTTKDQYK